MDIKNNSANFLSLLASSATLICCALPALFVVLGAGASFASLITIFPFLVTLSHYKTYISLFALLMISIAGYTNYKSYYLPCPTDPELGNACMQMRKKSRYLFFFSVGLFLMASTFTYIIPRFI